MIAPLVATAAAALSGSATLSLPPSVTATASGKASLVNGDARLPVARGRLNGTIRLAGGLRLKRDGRSVALSSFELDGKRLTAKVDGINRRAVFVLREPEVERGPVTTTIRSAVRGTPALTLGTAELRGRLAVKATTRFLKLAGGRTELQLDQAFRDVLAGEMITPGGGEGSPLTEDGAITFPISRGRLASRSLEGIIEQGGGLTFSKSNVPAIRLEDYLLDTRKNSVAGRINDAADRVELYTVTLAKGTIEGDVATFAPATVALTQTAADTLNTTFESTAFSAGQTLGMLTVRAQFE